MGRTPGGLDIVMDTANRLSWCKQHPNSFTNFAILIALVIFAAGCRNEPDGPTPTSTAVPSDISPDSPIQASRLNSVEVTQIVVETRVVVITPTPTAKPQLPKHLNICVSEEPESLYLYSSSRTSVSKEHVLNAIYEPLYTTLTYDYQSLGLAKIPSLKDGDAEIVTVEVTGGDKVIDARGNIVTLRDGTIILTSLGEEAVYSGEPLTMDQLIVRFELKPMTWSDGTAVTAGDSVYSFELAADPLTPVAKIKVDRTVEYRATGDRTLEWTGLPGFMDREYFTNIWTPLPRHAWADMEAADLLLADEVNQLPLSYGPYVISEWVTGQEISFVRNEHYYKFDNGFPLIDSITIKFVPNSEQSLPLLLSGQCEVLTHDLFSLSDTPALLEAAEKGLIEAHFQPGTVFEHIDFGINPIEEYETERPDWFEKPLVRQAFMMCTNRQAIIDELLYGQSALINAYVPDNHPLFPDEAVIWPYDVERANELLDEAGYLDFDEDGLRNDPRLGGEFQVDLLVALGNSTGLQIAKAFQNDLTSCGIEVAVESIKRDIYYSDGPDSPLFGRRFDLAEFPWLISIEPNCSLYLSSRTPGPDNNWNRTFNNQTGFENSSFNQACQAALEALPGTEEYEENHREALRIWTEQAPVIPLFLRLKMAATIPEVSGFSLDSTQISSLWNLSNLDINETESSSR